ncbi:MAG: DUF131 domain-containing protein [Candidatus Calditenuis sp.]|nr:DUF131 domain-containing protein [Candidatus Calditenuis sp.]
MRSSFLTFLGIAMVALGLIALMILLGSLGGEVKGFGIILIGPIPIIVSDGPSFPLVMLLAVTLFLLVVFLVLRTTLRGHQQD